jgi:hypothetical protein
MQPSYVKMVPPAAKTLLKKGSGLLKFFIHGENLAICLLQSCLIDAAFY